MNSLNPRIVWTWFFVLVNVVCGFVIFETNGLLGEASGVDLDKMSSVFWVTLLVASSYLIILLWVFPAFSKIKVRGYVWWSRDLGNAVGFLILILQIGYIAFFEKTGTGVAGSQVRSDSVLSPLWVLISCDSLLFIYYGFYRSSRLFLPNLIIGIVSNLLRGWNGIFMIILFMESARLMRTGRLKLRHLAIAGILVVVGYPVIFVLKFQMRAQLSHGFSVSDLTALLTAVLANIDASGYIDIVKLSLLGMFARLQIVSDAIVVFQSSHHIGNGIANGSVSPFWREGLLGLVSDRISGNRMPDLGVALADVIDPWHTDNWNANPSYIGWLFVLPLWTPIYILYTWTIGGISVCLVKMMKPDQMALDMLWFAWCMYLIPGWLASFVLFTFSLVVFWLLHLVAILFFRWKALLGSPRSSRLPSALSKT